MRICPYQGTPCTVSPQWRISAGNRQADERNGDVYGLLRLGAVASRFADQTQPATWPGAMKQGGGPPSLLSLLVYNPHENYRSAP